ncbi:monovalent cation/H+ antiporter subunit D [Pseudorhizobium endolithicum]|uniref:Monovalent cation/H+ antiporter subunit D n=1 Tax=Pseudorhizobium endolithicum TaxID=1191678 RepID=A0ABM8PMM7_9HYPH|nr:monovalent cation/H+ antiporter subunit D [Pseudorhizobium endolithicum]CAD6405732.1 monovalent cation/H+ antiporter subunit D [Rhizobium sp. Q54]CAD7038261.1 monovalent cation/H+ antiporter subunit D [Pseudorhizobium endolithicum]
MIAWSQHLIILPILLPLLAGTVLLFIADRQRVVKAMVSLASTIALAAISLMHVGMIAGQGSFDGVYLLGNWEAPFGIVLVADRLSAFMVALTAVLAVPILTFSLARWHSAGAHFHSLYQFLLMGLNGAFLTGDLFNLFVFFEVMLASSYGLVLHGSGPLRVKAGMHYIVVNLAAALLFLIGVSLIYGTAGTLNMADLAERIPAIEPDRRMLMEAGAAVLGVAFLTKAGMWPLCFWLPSAYSVAAAPVAAIFTLMSKVGVYIILRLTLLLFSEGPSAGFGSEVLLYGGMATLVFGTIGVLASQALGRIGAYSVLVSSGTLLAVIGLGDAAATSAALLYLLSSTLTLGAFFMLVELVERSQDAGATVLAVTMEAYGDADDDIPEEVEGVTMPATLAMLGICFAACTILLSGLPPLSGFVAKFAMLSALIGTGSIGVPPSGPALVLVTLVILGGLATLIALTRAGIRTFWSSIEGTVPRVLVMEIVPVMLILAVTAALAVKAGPALAYMEATIRTIEKPSLYSGAVRQVVPVPSWRDSRPTQEGD